MIVVASNSIAVHTECKQKNSNYHLCFHWSITQGIKFNIIKETKELAIGLVIDYRGYLSSVKGGKTPYDDWMDILLYLSNFSNITGFLCVHKYVDRNL